MVDILISLVANYICQNVYKYQNITLSTLNIYNFVSHASLSLDKI